MIATLQGLPVDIAFVLLPSLALAVRVKWMERSHAR
jgi:hypothetical protein